VRHQPQAIYFQFGNKQVAGKYAGKSKGTNMNHPAPALYIANGGWCGFTPSLLRCGFSRTIAMLDCRLRAEWHKLEGGRVRPYVGVGREGSSRNVINGQRQGTIPVFRTARHGRCCGGHRPSAVQGFVIPDFNVTGILSLHSLIPIWFGTILKHAQTSFRSDALPHMRSTM
jgi:hypothetical protein